LIHIRASPGGRKQAVLFWKKEPKNFLLYEVGAAATRAPISKSFCFFFQKEALFCFGRVSLNGSRCYNQKFFGSFFASPSGGLNLSLVFLAIAFFCSETANRS
jgi:hypothetical protein